MDCVKCKASLPKDCKMLSGDELAKISGGITVETVFAIIVGCIECGRLSYDAGKEAGRRAYDQGLRRDEWQAMKGRIRLMLCGTCFLGAAGIGIRVGMGIVLAGFESGLYDCIRQYG